MRCFKKKAGRSQAADGEFIMEKNVFGAFFLFRAASYRDPGGLLFL